MNTVPGPFRRLFRSFGSFELDLRLGGRMLIKQPGIALVAIFGIAVGVAIAAGGFSIIYGNFLNPSLPLAKGDRIVAIEMWDSAARKPERRILRDFQVWRDTLQSVQDTGAFRRVSVNLVTPGVSPQVVVVAAISASGFDVARRVPLLGRYLTVADERETAPAVIVISESVWRNRYGGDPLILERSIQLGDTRHAVVGVMPADFAFPVNDHFWVPLRTGTTRTEPGTGPELMVFGRLTSGATLQTAQAELATVWQRSPASASYAHLRPQMMSYPRPFLGIHRPEDVTGLHTMNGLIVLLLLLVCLNVAILVYTRTASRRPEISLRTALGASRGRIIGQLFAEALVLSATGAATGVAIAEFALRQVASATAAVASDLPFWLSFHVSPASVLYAGGLSVFAAGIIGILPAIRATKRTAQVDTRVAGMNGSDVQLGKTWTVLIVAQVGFAVALLPGALLATWENLRVEFVEPGFAAGEFLTATPELNNLQGGDSAVAGTQESDRRHAVVFGELMRRLQSTPDVSAATFAMTIPGDERSAVIEAEDNHRTSTSHSVTSNRVDVGFFKVLAVPILAGRGFESADAQGAVDPGVKPPEGGAVVVNESLARQVFAGNALGRRVRYLDTDASQHSKGTGPSGWYQIVGIVRDFPTGVSPEMNGPSLRMYHPAGAGQVHPVTIAIHVRDGNVASFARRLPELAASVHSDLQLRNVMPLDQALRREQWIRRLEAAVLGATALSVLMLSASGIYALMSFTVARRRKEIGIRMALGADGMRVVASIFSRSFAQLGCGAFLGATLAGALDAASGNLLLREKAIVVLPAVGMCMVAVGAAASLIPARRCLRIEPTEALREQ